MTNKCLAVENSTIPCAIKNLKCHVLVAEDSRVAQALFYRILTEAGFDATLDISNDHSAFMRRSSFRTS